MSVVGKYAESLLTPGWASEFAAIPIALNSVWPATTVASTGMMVVMGEDAVKAQARRNIYRSGVALPKVPVHR